MDRKYLERKIVRISERIDGLQSKYGNGLGYTYHAGWNLGYWEGKLAVYIEMLEALDDHQEA